jgi:hypothetical protein
MACSLKARQGAKIALFIKPLPDFLKPDAALHCWNGAVKADILRWKRGAFEFATRSPWAAFPRFDRFGQISGTLLGMGGASLVISRTIDSSPASTHASQRFANPMLKICYGAGPQRFVNG